jgi:hypothetical protein
MLTVKHMEVTGHENIYPAARVSYQPRQAVGEPNILAPCVFIDTPKGDTIPLGSWGTFYVMNEAGKTVAKYDLGGWPDPVGSKQSMWVNPEGTLATVTAANTYSGT